MVPPTLAGEEAEGGDTNSSLLDMEALEVNTKHMSLDSAYTSEADLDSSHNTTAANSGTASPKEPRDIIEESSDGSVVDSAPFPPKQLFSLRFNEELQNVQVSKTVSEVTGQ